MIAAVLVVLAVVVVPLVVPLPGPMQVRDWVRSVGPLVPVVFFAAHVVVTMAPFPRTVFTLSAGLLFGPALGLSLALAATTVSALLTLLVVRAIGRDWVAARLTHPAVRTVDQRLARRGWLAVGSLRLIAAVPFSVLNYCAALSSVRTLPYLVATVAGIIPGTIGVVLLGNQITSGYHPAQLALSGSCLALGVIGLLVDARWKPAVEPAGKQRIGAPQ